MADGPAHGRVPDDRRIQLPPADSAVLAGWPQDRVPVGPLRNTWALDLRRRRRELPATHILWWKSGRLSALVSGRPVVGVRFPRGGQVPDLQDTSLRRWEGPAYQRQCR